MKSMPALWSQVFEVWQMKNDSRTLSEVMVRTMTFATCIAIAFSVYYPANLSAEEHTVEIKGFKFVPASIDAKSGDTITWVNRDIAPHTATSKDGRWDTGILNQNESKTLVVGQDMNAVYFCKFHESMSGTIVTNSQRVRDKKDE